MQKNAKHGIILKEVPKERNKREVGKMTGFTLIYLLIFVIFALVAFAIMQIKLFGMKVKDFWSFIEANQMLDKLYKFARQYENMSPQEQLIYLAEAERIFTAFDKVPDTLWEEEYDKYKTVVSKYKDIKMIRWAEENK
ncbi:MAG: hypothetical protein HFJ33_07620 [Clostridia bacterium]|nr:hypothetical protein [Clostridia bacterium]